ncbi:hypothetical protein DKT68_13335 [Micromonospora acroterricola]|uniref:Uncharacterized protein n=1 Tax=Micromonospora acroterricola TaxID=2202421 RepID=A0A317D871_9ACTN|nr:hypothetical protein DKT68_13335 [Micromonospora acroterricola]
MMDVVEHAMDRLRHRWPLHFTVAGAVAWLLVIVTYLILALKVSGGTDELLGLLAFFGIPPLLLLGTVVVWGVDRVPWPVWPVGVAPLVGAAGGAPTSPSQSLVVSTVTSVMAFVYAQLILLTLQSVDVLRATTPRSGRSGVTVVHPYGPVGLGAGRAPAAS